MDNASESSGSSPPPKRAKVPNVAEEELNATDAELEDRAPPRVACTNSTYFQGKYAGISDRQRLRWALQTEDTVRFSKLRNRGDFSGVDAPFQTLNNEHTIDIYPKNAFGMDKKETSRLSQQVKADLHAYLRISDPSVFAREPDESFSNSVTKLDLAAYSKIPKAITGLCPNSRVVPPNLLFFEIILEGFLGYRVPVYNHEDGSMPRAAVMGGAVLACLTAWQDPDVRNMFTSLTTRLGDLLDSGVEDKYYFEAKEKLVVKLNSYFRYEDKEIRAPFASGDVDIFLQASPLSRALQQRLQHLGLPLDVLQTIESFIGGCGFVHEDLRRFSHMLCKAHLKEAFETVYYSDRGSGEFGAKACSFVCALAKNGLSFTLTLNKAFQRLKRPPNNPDVRYWPRTTQLIMLNERADLLGSLMDFDISIAACAYDGTSVRLMPRAVYSLMTATQVVTPFVLQEKRNRGRIVKYYKRGFDAYVIDPWCSHGTQCDHEPNLPFERDIIKENTRWNLETSSQCGSMDIQELQVAGVEWRSKHLRGAEQYRRIKQSIRDIASDDQTVIQCCCNVETFSADVGITEDIKVMQRDSPGLLLPRHRDEPDFLPMLSDLTHHHHRLNFSIALFERSEGHAIDYFSNRFGWTADQRRLVASFPSIRQHACYICRHDYARFLIISQASSIEAEEDILHGETSYKDVSVYDKFFSPCFYSAGTFNSIHAGSRARSTWQMLRALQTQHIAEKTRYIQRRGTEDGFLNRFVFSTCLSTLFSEGSNFEFPAQIKPPVGLNPERFVAKCGSCKQWLLRCEFGTTLCASCVT